MEILKAKLIWSGFCISSPSSLHRLAKQHFDERYKCKTLWVIFEPTRAHHLDLKALNFDNPIFILGCFSLKVVYNSCKLQRHSQVAKFLFIYSFTHTNFRTNSLSFQAPTYWNCHPHKRLLPDEVFQWG